MRIVAVSLVAVGLVTCSQTVKLRESGRKVEFLNHEYVGQHGHKCEELGTITVHTIPAELSAESDLSVIDIKLKNAAGKLGATHILRWPVRQWPCNKDGSENPESERTCSEAEGTAMSCIIGRGN